MNKQLFDYVYKALTGLATLSLAANGWFITREMTEMTQSLKDVNQKMETVAIEHASIKKEVEIQHNWVNSHHDRLQYVEAAVNKFQGYFERRP